MLHRTLLPSLLSLGLFLAGCGNGDATCTLGTAEGCSDGQVCEIGPDGAGLCTAPLLLRGRVFDLADDGPIEGARVLALDANGVAVSPAVVTDATGAYELPVPTARDAMGAPTGPAVVLRVTASGYQTFALAPRVALPIDRTAPVEVDGVLVVQSATTEVGLVATGGSGARIEGRIDSTEAGGALVVAMAGSGLVSSALADRGGEFVLFDVPPGSVRVEAYRAGIRILPADVTVAAGAPATVVLATATDGLATVEGSVQIVNAPGGSSTSVILVLESTFSETFARGEAPAGLRAAPVSGTFSIPGVPPGRYVALAAFENDGLVRDPDTSIGGTEIVHFEVPAAGGTVTLGDGFKVTEALEVVSPGADGLEIVDAGDPTFVWADDSSEDGYEIRVYDALGMLVHENTMVARVTGSPTVSYTWTGATLTPSMIYQFRALSYSVDRDGAHIYLSATEDLRGAFQAP